MRAAHKQSTNQIQLNSAVAYADKTIQTLVLKPGSKIPNLQMMKSTFIYSES